MTVHTRPEATLGEQTQAYSDIRSRSADESRPSAVDAQHGRGAMTARERVDYLVDTGSFAELGSLAWGADRNIADSAGDGIVIGRAYIDARPVVVVAYDFTVNGASMGRVNDEKFARARQISLRSGIPLVMLIEGGGARITERMGSTTIRGHERFSDLGLLSGWAPIVTGVVGPTYAGHANLVALSDFVVMTTKASLGLAGPRLVKAATGEEVTQSDFNSALHARKIGSIDREAADDAELLDIIRGYLSYLPSNCSLKPPRLNYPTIAERDDERLDERLDDEVLTLVPAESSRAYDMRRLVATVVDDGEFFELKPGFARNVITAFARVGGHSVGIIANNPLFMAGVLDGDSSDKMARFINICDAYNIPILVLVDVPGYIVGVQAERTNLVRRSMRPLWELSQSTVPIMTVVIRKAYGLAYHTMGGAEFHPELMVCWPTARVSPMGAEGAVNILHGKKGIVDDERRAALIDTYKALEEPIAAAEEFKIDDVIDPRDTRQAILRILDFVADRPHQTGHWRPAKRRGISPH